MRYARVQTDSGTVAWAQLDGVRATLLDGPPYAGGRGTSQALMLSGARLLAPCTPSKVIGVGLNYHSHRADRAGSDQLLAGVVSRNLKEGERDPILFLKAPSAVIGPGEAIVLPPESGRVDYEAELAVIIGRKVHRPSREEAASAVFGCTCANDVSARDLQDRDVQWARAKSYDTFCPIGPWIQTDIDPDDVLVEGLLSGDPRQHARTSELIVGVTDLIHFAAQAMTLWPGDVLLTGTPSGLGSLRRGDVFTVRVEGIGELVNPVE